MTSLKRISYSVLATLFATNAAFAQNGGGSSGMGGGGDILICEEVDGIKRYLLDTHEEKSQYTIDAGDGLTVETRAAHVLGRLADLDPVRASRYAEDVDVQLRGIRRIRQWLKEGKKPEEINRIIYAEVATDPKIKAYVLAAEIPLKDVDDAAEIYNYEAIGCQKKQLVIQQKNPATGKLEFVYDFDLLDSFGFDSRGLNQQLAAATHEAVYHERRDRGAITSKDSRKYNRQILDPSMKRMPSCRYHRELVTLGFGGYMILGVTGSSGSKFTCDANDNIDTIQSSSYPFFALQGKAPYLNLSNLKLSNGRVPVSAQNPDIYLFPVVGNGLSRRVGRDERYVSGGSILFQADGTLKWEGVYKYQDSGSVSFVTDPFLKVLSLQDEGFYNDPIPAEVRARVSSFVWEVKKLEPVFSKNNVLRDRVTAIATWIRQGIPAQDYNRIEVGIRALRDPSVVIPAVADDRYVADWTDAFSNARIRRCVVGQLWAGAGFVIGVRFGKISARCFRINGDQIAYRGKLMIPFAASVGAALASTQNQVEFEQEDGDRVSISKSAADPSQEFLGWKVTSAFQDNPDERLGFGLMESLSLADFGKERFATFKPKKNIPGIYGIVENLLSKILVDRKEHPTRDPVPKRPKFVKVVFRG